MIKPKKISKSSEDELSSKIVRPGAGKYRRHGGGKGGKLKGAGAGADSLVVALWVL